MHALEPTDLPTLRTERLYLRPFTLDDAPRVRELAGDARVADTTLHIPHPYGEGMAETFIRSIPAALAEHRLIWAVADPAEGVVGAIELRVEPSNERAEMGYWIGVPFHGRGYATEAAAAVCDHAFNTLGLRRVYAHYMVRNPASGRVLTKVGMRREGVLREHVVARGRVEDLVICGVLRSEWGVR